MLVERATNAQVKSFCNKVRKAGGTTVLHALMPSVPQDATQCLLAKNLNFNSYVNCDNKKRWYMELEDGQIAKEIADKLELKRNDRLVYLPEKIGAVARDFDELWRLINRLDALTDPAQTPHQHLKRTQERIEKYKARIKPLKGLWPLIEEAEREAYANAPFINAKGQIVL